MQWWQWLVLIVANTPIYLGLGWAIFGSWDGLGDALRYCVSPDEWSWLRGEWLDDWWAELKLFFWLGGCALAVWGESALIDAYWSGQ